MDDDWSEKDKRQFDHIKTSSVERGKSEQNAAEIAGRTVNKQRRLDGRTENKTTQGTGNPNSRLEERTYAELYNLARKESIEGRSKLNKDQLIEMIRQKRA